MSGTRSGSSTTPASQQSGTTIDHYRFITLGDARIRIHHQPTPGMRAQIHNVIQRNVTPERHEELSLVAQELSGSFYRVVSHANREDDCIEPLYQVLSFMDHSKSFTFPRKAGLATPTYLCLSCAYSIFRLAIILNATRPAS